MHVGIFLYTHVGIRQVFQKVAIVGLKKSIGVER